ncbi:voltage-gated hydrogen channel 1 [Elysia marginata]|uniref:Voltage-gated hydrogen channel 1 n=1 Tax=Elysia marginata TaxID=1093978 RepID=A0AAV4J2K4_9GAST|nr:voltage-gated hydrogen channel 1 [Elysia marginata]
MILKNKYMLLTVALFCVTECALILGELILDLHKVKDVLEEQEKASFDFVKGLNQRYPVHVPSPDLDIDDVYTLLLQSNVSWPSPNSLQALNSSGSGLNSSLYANHYMTGITTNINNITSSTSGGSNSSSSGSSSGSISSNNYLSYASSVLQHYHRHRKRSAEDYFQTGYVITRNNKSGSTDSSPRAVTHGSPATAMQQSSAVGHTSHRGHDDNSLEKKIASALHTASITICSILVFEVRIIY